MRLSDVLLVALAVAFGSTSSVAEPLRSEGQGMPTRAGKRTESPPEREHRLGVQAQLKGNPATARKHFDAALKLDAKFAPAWVGLASLAQASGDVAAMERYLREAERVSPRAPEVPLAWGRLHVQAGRFEEAEKSFLAARDLAPQAVPPLIDLGNLYLRMPGRAKDAAVSFERALQIYPQSGAAHFGLGAASAASGQRDKALLSLQKAAELNPKDGSAWRLMGRLHLEKRDVPKALRAFDEGLARAPNDPFLMLDRVDALATAGRWKDAEAQLAKADKAVPNSAVVALKAGDLQQAQGRLEQAAERYARAIELDPKNPMAYNNLAWVTVERKGDADKAIGWANKAVELSPRSSPFVDTLAWAQRYRGDLAAAQQSLSRALALEPGVALYHYHAALVHKELQQPRQAREAAEQALKLNPAESVAQDARRLLREVGSAN